MEYRLTEDFLRVNTRRYLALASGVTCTSLLALIALFIKMRIHPVPHTTSVLGPALAMSLVFISSIWGIILWRLKNQKWGKLILNKDGLDFIYPKYSFKIEISSIKKVKIIMQHLSVKCLIISSPQAPTRGKVLYLEGYNNMNELANNIKDLVPQSVIKTKGK